MKIYSSIQKDEISLMMITEQKVSAGICQASCCSDKTDEFYFNRLFVNPKYRNQGYATQLLTEMLKLIKERNITLQLDINPYGDLDYLELERFYVKHGFKKYLVKNNAIGDFYTYFYNKKEE